MNDQEFELQAYTNPWSDDPAFQAALEDNPARRTLVDALRQQDSRLLVEPPEGLQSQLLDISRTAQTDTSRPAAANDRHWRRLLPLAASLLLALSLTLYFVPDNPAESNAGNQQNMADLRQSVLDHLHREESMLSEQPGSRVDLDTVNAHLAKIGMQLQTNRETRTLEVTNLKDCVVDRNPSLHLVLRSTRGQPVSVLFIDNPPVEDELPIDDPRFHGFVVPTKRGNLVVVSERQPDPEARALQNLFAGNMR